MKNGRMVPLLGVGAALLTLSWLAIPLLQVRTPRATWTFGPDAAEIEPYGKVPAFDPATLTIDLPFRAHVYVASFSQQQGLRAMFPSDYLKSDLQNPLPAGQHRLPGTTSHQGQPKVLQWQVPDVTDQPIAFFVIVSREPLVDLHAAMRTCFQIGNVAFPDLSFGSYMPKGGKQVLPPRHVLPHALWQDLSRDMEAAMPGPMRALKSRAGVFVKSMPLLTQKAREGHSAGPGPYAPQLEQLKQQLRERQRSK